VLSGLRLIGLCNVSVGMDLDNFFGLYNSMQEVLKADLVYAKRQDKKNKNHGGSETTPHIN